MTSAMDNRTSALGPGRVLVLVLAMVFVTEFSVMVSLPFVLPPTIHDPWLSLIDALLLTLIIFPLLWWVLIGPLQATARAERAKATAIVDTAADGIFSVDSRGQIVTFNRAAEKIFDCVAADACGQDASIFVPSFSSLMAELGNAVVTPFSHHEARVRNWEVEGLRRSGVSFPLALGASRFVVHQQFIITAIVRDLTVAKAAEAELAARAAQQAAIAQLGHAALAGSPLDELARKCIQKIKATLGAEQVCVAQLDAAESSWILRGQDPDHTPCEMAEVQPEDIVLLHATEPRTLSAPELRRLQAGWPWLALPLLKAGVVATVFDEARPFGILLVAWVESSELTENERYFLQAVAAVLTTSLQRERHEELRRQRDALRAEKMAAVAQVGTSVAHELRNPLTALLMLAQTLGEELAENQPAAQDLHRMEHEIGRMRQYLQTFLDFARPPRLQRQRFDLALLLRDSLALLSGRATRQRVEIRYSPPKEPLWLSADPEQIQQILLNLGLNALDVMPQGGVLAIELQNLADVEVQVQFLDSGPGVSPQIMPRLFEAFSTDKETGSGLGLAISRRIAEDHGGTLSARNRANGGACFTLRLPAKDLASLEVAAHVASF